MAVGDFTGQVVIFDMVGGSHENDTDTSDKSGKVPNAIHGPNCFAVAQRARMLQAVRSIAWHPNGRVVAVGCMDGTIVLWHIKAGIVFSHAILAACAQGRWILGGLHSRTEAGCCDNERKGCSGGGEYDA